MKKLVAALAVALICAGIGAAWLWQEWRDARSQNASLQARVERLENPRPAPITATPEVHGANTSAVPTGTAAVPAEQAVASSQSAADTQPAFARMMLAQTYPDLAQELGLAPDELDKFLDLLASQRTNPVYNAKRLEADQAAIAAMLGSRYTQWQDYQQTLPGRQQVTQLRGQLAAAGSTLAETQVRPLMAALNAEQKRIAQDSRDNPPPLTGNQQEETEQGVRQVTEGNRRLVAAAAPYLTPQQLDGYRQMLDQQAGMVRAMVETLSATQSQNGTAK